MRILPPTFHDHPSDFSKPVKVFHEVLSCMGLFWDQKTFHSILVSSLDLFGKPLKFIFVNFVSVKRRRNISSFISHQLVKGAKAKRSLAHSSPQSTLDTCWLPCFHCNIEYDHNRYHRQMVWLLFLWLSA